jgi:hypothetical protein
MSTDAEAQEETDRLVQAILDRRQRRRIKSPSPRQPEMSRHFNHADQIETQLEEDGHRTWGFVIYRTTYTNDYEWAEFLRRLRSRMEHTFDDYNGRDILDLFTLTVIEDRQLLEGASTATVRDHFRQWRATAPQLEQARDDDTASNLITCSPRYRYAIQVDEASLRSIIYDAPVPPEIDLTKRGWVKLLDASWQPTLSERIRYSFEPIEGVTERNVGWMKIPYQNSDEYYVNCRNLNYWITSYQRPPVVMGYPYDG